MNADDPHSGQEVLGYARPVGDAGAAMVMLHGRGSTAGDILTLADAIGRTDFAYLAPQARGGTWYPYGFMQPIEQNEPWLGSALSFLDRILEQIALAGVSAERTMLLGFSQGACLTLEYVARHARRYGGVVALTGGLIGPDGTARDYAGTLGGTPMFIGSADPDPHIPVERVHASAAVLERMGGSVTTRIYPGMGHTVNEDEIAAVRELLRGMAETAPKTGSQ